MASILIVDDDENLCSAFGRFLTEQGHVPLVASNVKDAVDAVATARPDLVVMDIRMPGANGLQGLAEIRRIDPDVYVVIMTAYGTSQTSIEAMRLGAYDYLIKPLDLDALQVVIDRALEAQAVSRAARGRSGEDAEDYALVNLIGASPPMQDAYKRIGLLTTNDVPALVIGERGVGKQLVARTIHFNSRRRDRPFVAVDCRTSAEAVLERELFGYGARAGADAGAATVTGKLEAACGGTLFLEGIEAVAAPLQAKLVRVIVDHAVERPGTMERTDVDVRFIAATDADLAAEVRQGRFSADLYDSLRVVPIELPPLRRRSDDIPLLATYFMNRYASELGKTIRGIDDRALRLLREHSWPGNVAELENAVRRACVLARGEVITSDALADSLQDTRLPRQAEAESTLELAVRTLLHELLAEDRATRPASAFYAIVRRVEETIIREALVATGGNQVRAAELLDLNRNTLRNKMRLYDL